MLARVKWPGGRYSKVNGQPEWEYGTLIAFVYTGHSIKAMIAMDGDEPYNRGRIIEKDYAHVTVTTWFKWSETGEVDSGGQ